MFKSNRFLIMIGIFLCILTIKVNAAEIQANSVKVTIVNDAKTDQVVFLDRNSHGFKTNETKSFTFNRNLNFYVLAALKQSCSMTLYPIKDVTVTMFTDKGLVKCQVSKTAE